MAKRSEAQAWLINEWEHNCGYASAVFSGFEPDAAHKKSGGYHCSVTDLRAYGNQNDYSNTRADDKDLNVEYGSAIDMSMSPADMVKCHGRVRAVFDDRSDPRRQYINAINTYDGSGDAVRLDFAANTASFASADHKWHNHGETRRRWNTDMTAARAMASVLRGDTKEQYQGGDVAKVFAVTDGPIPNGLYGSGGSGFFWFASPNDVQAYMAAFGVTSPAAGWTKYTLAQAKNTFGPYLGSKDGLSVPVPAPGTPGKDGLTAEQVKTVVQQAVAKIKIVVE